MPGKIRIGVSNGQMPGNKSGFPPAYQSKSRLHYYSTLFNTIEVNSCFYKTPLQSTYEKWEADVPNDFQFTLKLSRDVTHAEELNFDSACVDGFFKAAEGIHKKRGCLLVQFPGKINIDHFNQVSRILEKIHDVQQGWRIAVEFRNASWYISETTELLEEYGAAIVLHDFAKARNWTQWTNASFAYIRLHGPTGNYRDSYDDHSINTIAGRAMDLSGMGKDVYIYFNNTAGNAFENAGRLQKKLTFGK